MERFAFTDKQAQAILDMRLARLTNLELDKLLAEYQELEKTIAYLQSLLTDETLLMGVIKQEMGDIRDKFAIERSLPQIDVGDILVIHDTGAHGFSMGYNYNGKLRSAEVLLKEDGSFQLIRR